MNPDQEGATPTPLTDAVFLVSMNPVVDASIALDRMESHAKSLERQLARLTAENAELRGRVEREKWDWDSVHDLYANGGHHLVDFLVHSVLAEVNGMLGGKGWDAYESDGGIDEAIGAEVASLLEKNRAIGEWDHRPLGPLLMDLIRLSDNESKRGKFRVTLDYDNYQDGARVLDGDGKNIGECYEDRPGNTDEDGPDNQFVGAIIKAVDASRLSAELGGGAK